MSAPLNANELRLSLPTWRALPATSKGPGSDLWALRLGENLSTVLD